MTISAAPGEVVYLDASASHDADGDELSFKWWDYQEAGTYRGSVVIVDSTTPRASLQVPPDARGVVIHVIFEVQDDGTPPLTSYRRILITVTQ